MKKIGFVAIAVAMLCGCRENELRSSGSGPMFRIHWIGAGTVPTGTNAFSKVLALESTTELRKEAFGKLARTPGELWHKSLQEGAVADQSALLRPLLDDLWNNESVVELRGSPAQPDLLVAVQVDNDRAELWSKNLRQAATGWKFEAEKPLNAGPAKGWSAAGKNLSVHYARSGQWVLAGVSHGSKPPFDGWLKSDRPTPALSGSIAEVQADWPRLHRAFPLVAKYPAPPMEMKISLRGQSLRTEGKFVHSERLPVKLEPWKIPTNLVIEPLISFTCAQGFAPLLDQIKGFSGLGLKNPPNQLCMWGLATVHAQTFLTTPMANPTNVIRELAPRLPNLVKAHMTNAPGNFVWISNRSEWIWSGLPMIIPHVRPEKTPNGEYLFAGLFPLGPKSNTAPAELFAQVTSRTNLVYYDWELSHERLSHARHMLQLSDIIHRRRLSSTNSISYRWTRAIEPLLGNSITEVTLSSPKELSFVRKSELGFTGFELMMLTRWIESPGFPVRYEPPPLISARTNPPASLKQPLPP